MPPTISIRLLKPDEKELINTIAAWYLKEWDIPLEKTFARLSQPCIEISPFQLVLFYKNQPAVTGGISYDIGLLKIYPEYKIYGPWVALLYTHPKFRGKGLAKLLLTKIEQIARKEGIKTLYLYTFTAQGLYLKNGWSSFLEVIYKGYPTSIMKKVMQ